MIKLMRILSRIALLPLLAVAALANTTATWYYPPSNLRVFDLYIPWPWDLFIASFITIAAIYGVYKFLEYLWNKYGGGKNA